MRALKYAFDEAVASLWRGRQSGALSTATIAVALFVLGVFLLVTSNLERLGSETPIVRPTVVVSFRDSIPPNRDFWEYYARGTYQNMAVFGKHFSWLQPGCYVFRLTPQPFDTTRLKDGVYQLVVTVADVDGNQSSSSQRFTVHNAPGVVGV